MGKVSGLEGVIAAETEISLVDGEHGILLYRGYLANELARRHTFEEVAFLLLFGNLPTQLELIEFKESLAERRMLPEYIMTIIDLLPWESSMMSTLRTAVSALESSHYPWPPTKDQVISIIAIIPTIIAYRHHQLQNTPFIPPNPELSHVENYLYMLRGKRPTQAQVQALTTYLILTCEHGMNASTFAARTVISTETDIISAIVGAIGTMKGPLHGGAPTEVIQMLNEISDKEYAESWLRDRLNQGERIMGFGHRIYKTHDPRSLALKAMATELSSDDPWLNLATHVEDTAIKLLSEYKPGRRLYTNVEFYAAAVMRAVNLPEELFTPTFTIARTVGWTAHLLEQSQHNRIFRPQSLYVGKRRFE